MNKSSQPSKRLQNILYFLVMGIIFIIACRGNNKPIKGDMKITEYHYLEPDVYWNDTVPMVEGRDYFIIPESDTVWGATIKKEYFIIVDSNSIEPYAIRGDGVWKIKDCEKALNVMVIEYNKIFNKVQELENKYYMRTGSEFKFAHK